MTRKIVTSRMAWEVYNEAREEARKAIQKMEAAEKEWKVLRTKENMREVEKFKRSFSNR